MFRGRYDHAIDKKGRLSIPAGFRMELQRRSEKAPVLSPEEECLVLYPYDEWEVFQAGLEAANQLDKNVQRLMRFFIGQAQDAPVDSQGRVLIPKNLREHARLDRDVSLMGMGSRIEIWDTPTLDRVMQETTENLDAMRAAIAVPGSGSTSV